MISFACKLQTLEIWQNIQNKLRGVVPPSFYIVRQVKTQMGYMNVAGAELTALDIVAEEQKIGGLGRAAEILVELCEQTEWDEAKLPLLAYFSCATIQRLGYLLELIEEEEQADRLYGLQKQTGKTMRKIPLKQSVAIDGGISIHTRWKIIKNYEIDIDDLPV